MVTVNNLSFSYGKHKVFENLSFHVDKGECLVLAGPNGSGKSTALSVIAGALKADKDSVSVDGKVGYIPQGTALLEDSTVKENLIFFSKLAKGNVPEKLPFSVEKYLERKVSRLSGGMKKQVSIACALIGDPNLILLDEPCAALDIAFRDEMISIIEDWKASKKSVIYVGHDPAEFYSFYDKIIFIDEVPKSYTRNELEGQGISTEAQFISFYKDSLLNIRRN